MEHNNGVCNNCNLNTCEKYCALKAGQLLANYIYTVDVAKSNIGDIRSSSKPNEESYIVTGMQLEGKKYTTDLLSTLNVSMEMSQKFNRFFDKSPLQLIKMYFATLGSSYDDYKKIILDKYKGIVNNTLLIIPFKPEMECDVKYEYKTGSSDFASKISSVKWSIDKETGKLNGQVIFRLDSIGFSGKSCKFAFEDYGYKFKNSGIERCMNNNDFDRKAIQVTRFGYIRPLIVKDGDNTLALDGYNIYLIKNSTMTIIATWNSNGELVETECMKSMNKSKALKYIRANLQYIEKHRNFIAPYAIVDGAEIIL